MAVPGGEAATRTGGVKTPTDVKISKWNGMLRTYGQGVSRVGRRAPEARHTGRGLSWHGASGESLVTHGRRPK